ncbi:hypothetical protein FRC11_014481, partial [Ceratobasidium sp. 423]
MIEELEVENLLGTLPRSSSCDTESYHTALGSDTSLLDSQLSFLSMPISTPQGADTQFSASDPLSKTSSVGTLPDFACDVMDPSHGLFYAYRRPLPRLSDCEGHFTSAPLSLSRTSSADTLLQHPSSVTDSPGGLFGTYRLPLPHLIHCWNHSTSAAMSRDSTQPSTHEFSGAVADMSNGLFHRRPLPGFSDRESTDHRTMATLTGATMLLN